MAEQCGIKVREATNIIEEVSEAIERWSEFADQARLPRKTGARIDGMLSSLAR